MKFRPMVCATFIRTQAALTQSSLDVFGDLILKKYIFSLCQKQIYLVFPLKENVSFYKTTV